MASKVILYMACSLNGKIARANGSVDWLEKIANPNQSDYGFQAFYEQMKYTIQGRSTYEQLVRWDIPFPYPSTENYVITSKTAEPSLDVQFWRGSPGALIQKLRSKGGGPIWLIGGGYTNTQFLNPGLIDELRVFMMPVILPDGISIFEGEPIEIYLTLIHHEVYESGVVELRYNLMSQNT